MTWSARFVGDAATKDVEARIVAVLKRALDEILGHDPAAVATVGTAHHGAGSPDQVAAAAADQPDDDTTTTTTPTTTADDVTQSAPPDTTTPPVDLDPATATAPTEGGQ